MRRLLFSGLLVALLLTTAGVVYAGVNWDDDPSFPVGHGLVGHMQAGWGDFHASAQYDHWVEERGDSVKVTGCVTVTAEETSDIRLRVWVTDGGDTVASKTRGGTTNRLVCASVTVELDD